MEVEDKIDIDIKYGQTIRPDLEKVVDNRSQLI